jgi:mitogen-activated protein kinase 15
MWSVGCILGELIVGKVIFTGMSHFNWLKKIIELLGLPNKEDLDAMECDVSNNILDTLVP